MNGNANLPPGSGTRARFPSQTQWTALIQPAADASSPEAQAALNQLCQAYWFPVYAFLRSQRMDSHQAKDLTQGFFLHLLEGRLIQQASRAKGRFRTFLLECLQNFMKDQWRKGHALKRGGGAAVFSIAEADAEEQYRQLPSVPPASAAVYDRTWAATVIAEALGRLEHTYADRGKPGLFATLRECLTGKLTPDAYPEVASRLGMSAETFQVNLTRFKKAFAEAVREAIAATVAPPDINDEIQHLMAAWSAYLREQP
jgi:RNA polymerase sigma-70 factor (ECF subfamily)